MKVAVISGKGGSGKSSVTASLIALSRRVVAIDGDVDASNLPLLFPHEELSQEPFVSGEDVEVDEAACIGCGRCVRKCAFHALRLNEQGIAEALAYQCEGCGLCVAICPRNALHVVQTADSQIYTSSFEKGIMVHGELSPGDDNSGKMIARMRAVADEQMAEGNFDVQILDGPPGIGCPVLSSVTGMDRVVLVAEPTLSGFADLQRAYEVASNFCSHLLVIINKCDLNAANRQKIVDFCDSHQLPVVAELPFDRVVVEAQLQGKCVVTYAPENPCSVALRQAHSLIFDKK